MSIQDNLHTIQKSLPEHVTLVAVSKTKPNRDILEAYHVGQRVFGENKVQELVQKHEELPKDIQWHMIGHLQTNKVKYISSFVSLIHGVDSIKLLKEINKQGNKNNRIINCLLQVHIAEESTKFGFDESEVKEILSSDLKEIYPYVNIVGLMGMATYTDDEVQIRNEFQKLKGIFSSFPTLKTLSMGMSGDYQMAVEEGSTMVRVGSSIFGNRNYN